MKTSILDLNKTYLGKIKARIIELIPQTLSNFIKKQFKRQKFQLKSKSSNIFVDCLLSQSSLYEQFSINLNALNIDFFDSHFNDKIVTIASIMKHSNKDIYFRNIYLFLEKYFDIALIKNEQLTKNNLFIYLRKLTLQ